jgi:glucan phosphoethanolaminetransferase (alkaline phosphatase superfamily)
MPQFSVRLLPAAALLLMPYLVMCAWLAKNVSGLSSISYAVTVATLLVLLAYVTNTWRRFFLLHLPLFLLGTVFAGYTIIGDQLPGDAIAYVLVTSSWDEVRGFFGLGQAQRLLLLFIAVALAYLWLSIRLPPRAIFPSGSVRIRWAVIGSLAVLGLFAKCEPKDFMTGIAANPLPGGVMFVTGPLSAANAQVSGKFIKKVPYGASHVTGEEIHILIVGESSRRDAWSVYGYSRPTTPFLESLKGEAIFFENAVTDSNATVIAVPILLTGIEPEDYHAEAIRGNLVDLAKEAGYYTSWLVNQDPSISWLIGMNADEAAYPHSISEFAMRKLAPDGTLLPRFQRQLARRGSPLFIGLHVNGSHWAYFDRYPAGFEQFGSGTGLKFTSLLNRAFSDHRMVDTYDNSILYTDWFLQQIIEDARKLTVPVTVTYLSDHGESLYALDGRAGHASSVYVPHEFDIPAFVWMNESYRQAHPDKVQAVISNEKKEVRTHDFFYSVADLMGIQWPGAMPERSFASSSFVPEPKEKHFAGGKLVARVD